MFSMIIDKAGLNWIVMTQARAQQEELQEAHQQKWPINKANAAKCLPLPLWQSQEVAEGISRRKPAIMLSNNKICITPSLQPYVRELISLQTYLLK
jgi:hypothetical protein